MSRSSIIRHLTTWRLQLLAFLHLTVFSLFFLHSAEVGSFMHASEGELVCRLTHVMVPYFNAGIYLQNKSKLGKVEEVFGPVTKVYFTVKTDAGVPTGSFKLDDKFFIGSDKLLPMARFTNPSKGGGGGGGGRGRGGGRGAGRGGVGRGRGGGGRTFGRGGGGRSFSPRGRGRG